MSLVKHLIAGSLLFTVLAPSALSAHAETKCVTKTVGIITCTGSLMGSGVISCKQTGTKQVTECTSDKSVVEFGDPELTVGPTVGPKHPPSVVMVPKAPAVLARR